MNLETFGVALILGWLSGAIFAARLISKGGGKVSLPYRDADQIAEAKEALRHNGDTHTMPSKAKTIQRTLDDDQVQDPENSRGFGVPWPVLSKDYGVPVAELQRLSGQPRGQDLEQPATQGTLIDEGSAE